MKGKEKRKTMRLFIKRMGQQARGVMLKTAEDVGGKEYKDKMKIKLKQMKVIIR